MSLEPIDSLIPHPANPRRGNLAVIEEMIRQNGFFGAIVAQRSTRHILVGNHRWRAARNLGYSEVPVIWRDCSDDEALRILTVDNRASDLATYNKDALLALLDELQETGGLAGTGYTDGDVRRISDELEALYATVEAVDPVESTPAKFAEERLITLKIGDISARVPAPAWKAWQDALYVRCGHAKPLLVAEFRRRLQL